MSNNLIESLLCLALLCVTARVDAAEPPTKEKVTLKGIVVERRANVKSFEAWNAPSDPYYVLALDLKPDENGKKRHITLRPSKKVPTAEFKRHRGLEVSIEGYYVEGKPYKPSDGESYPIEIDALLPEIEALTRRREIGWHF